MGSLCAAIKILFSPFTHALTVFYSLNRFVTCSILSSPRDRLGRLSPRISSRDAACLTRGQLAIPPPSGLCALICPSLKPTSPPRRPALRYKRQRVVWLTGSWLFNPATTRHLPSYLSSLLSPVRAIHQLPSFTYRCREHHTMAAIRRAADEVFLPKLQPRRPTMGVGKIGRGETSSTLSHLEGAQRRLGAGIVT